MWIARDENGALYSYPTKPNRYLTSFGLDEIDEYCFFKLKPELFPEITWDTEPKWVRIVKPEWIQDDWMRDYDSYFMNYVDS